MGPHLTPHTPHSDQISSPVQPQVSHGKDSDVSFHTAAYSQCSNTETAQAGASEEDPQTRNPWAFTPSQSPRSLLFLLSLWLLPPCSLCPSTSLAHGLYLLCYLAVFPSVHSPGWCYPPPHPLLSQRLAVHGLPSQAPTQSSAFQSASQSAACEPGYLGQMYSSTFCSHG